MGWQPTIPLIVDGETEGTLGAWRMRVPTAREAIEVVQMDKDTTAAQNATLRRICAAWWPLSMMATFFCRSISPSLPLAIAQYAVAHCTPAPAADDKQSDVCAQTSEADSEWDEIAAEVVCESGLTLDAPWNDWLLVARHIDRVRARRALNQLSWYTAAKSDKEKAYKDLLKRAGFATPKKRRKNEKAMSADEGLAAFEALQRDTDRV